MSCFVAMIMAKHFSVTKMKKICLIVLITLLPSIALAQKHLIFLDGELGWYYSMPPYLAAHHAEVEQLPFSGFVVVGNVYTSYVMSADSNSNDVTYQRVWEEVKSLQNLFTKKTENFLRINIDFPGDFWDDAIWQKTTNNFAAVAKAAKNLGFKGILFDDEPYTSNQHRHSLYMSNFKFPKRDDVQSQCDANLDVPCDAYALWERKESIENRGDWVDYSCFVNGQDLTDSEECSYRNPVHSFKEHMDKVASRFQEIMEAMEAEFPAITVLVLHGPATAHAKTNVDGHYIKPNSIFETNEYKGAMFLGLKQGLNGDARLHDMGEFYQYTTRQQFRNAYQWRKYDIVSDQYNQDLDDTYRWVVPANDRPTWSRDVNIGFMVSDYGRYHDMPEYNTQNLCHPADVQSRLTKALQTADEYVIFYSDSSLSTCENNLGWADVETPVPAPWLTMMQNVYNSLQFPWPMFYPALRQGKNQ